MSMQVLRPTYTMRVEVTDRACGGAFDSLSAKTGCDEILAKVTKALADAGIGTGDLSCFVFFEKFEHR